MAVLAAPVIVCGFSAIAMRIVDQLVRSGVHVELVVPEITESVTASTAESGVSRHAAGVNVTAALRAAGVARAQAVVCVDDRELWNLEAALVAARLRPDIRVVLQLDNATVADAVRATGATTTVLDIADLAAPSVIEACLGVNRHTVDIAGTEFVVADLRVPRGGTLRELFGDIAPVAVARGAADEQVAADLIRCPGRDLRVDTTDVVSVVGTPAQLSDQQVVTDTVAPLADIKSTPRDARRHRAVSAARRFVADANPNFFRMLGVLVVLIAVSTVILRLGYRKPGMTVLDAVYFSSETIATVGYGDFNFSHQPDWLRVWSILLMFAGLTTTAMIMAFLAELLISRRLSEGAGRLRAQAMSAHVVVVGLGAFGIRVAEGLRSRGHGVVIVERASNDRLIATAGQLGLPIIFGDATVAETLRDAGVDRCAAVAVLTSDDMTNIEVGIAARTLLGRRWVSRPGVRGVPVVLRIFDRALGQAVGSRFGFNHARSTAELAAPWFIGAALGLQVMATFSVSSESFMVGRLPITPESGLAGMEMQELSGSTRVIAIGRADSGDLEHPPRRGTRLHAGDDAYLIGPWEELIAILERDHSHPVADRTTE